MSPVLSAAEAQDLIRLCETGRLYEVEAWIRAGKALEVPTELRKTPLGVALSTGFHSLVELLLQHEESQQIKNDARRLALQMNRPPLGDTAAVTALLDRLLHHAHVLKMRTTQLAHQSPHRLASRGRDEVKHTCLACPTKLLVLPVD